MTGIWRAGAEQMSGWAGNPTDQYFEGTLDELAVYTDVVTPAEVLSHHNAGKTPRRLACWTNRMGLSCEP